MDIVYILGTGSCWEDNEIRFSLRSVEKNVVDLGRVFIVGECPDWLQNIIHIPAEDPFPNKWRNGLHKILTACKDERISEDFLLMNDDFFIIKKIKAAECPYYYRGELGQKDKRLTRRFLTTQEYTRKYLSAKNRRGLNFAIHRPIRYNKKLFLDMPIADFPYPSFSPRSFYCNYYNVKGERCQDPIITPGRTKEEIENSFASYTDFSITTATARSGVFRSWIKNKFPEPSRFEKTSKH